LELQIPVLVESGGLGLKGLLLEAAEDGEEGGQGVIAFNRLGLVHRDTLDLYQPVLMQPQLQQLEQPGEEEQLEAGGGLRGEAAAVKQEIKEEVDEQGRRVGSLPGNPVAGADDGGENGGEGAQGPPPRAAVEVIDLCVDSEDEVVELSSDEPEEAGGMQVGQVIPAATDAGRLGSSSAVAAAAGDGGSAGDAGGAGEGGSTGAAPGEAAAGAAARPAQLDHVFAHGQLAVGYAVSVKEDTKVIFKFILQDDHHNLLDHLNGKLQLLEHRGWRKQRQQQQEQADALDSAAAAAAGDGMDVDEVAVLTDVVLQGGKAFVEWHVRRGVDRMGEHLLEVRPVSSDLQHALPLLLRVKVSEGNYPTELELKTLLPPSEQQQHQQQVLLMQLDNSSDRGPALPALRFVLHTRDGALMPVARVRSLVLRVFGEGGTDRAQGATGGAGAGPSTAPAASRGGAGTPRRGARGASSAVSGGRTFGRAAAARTAALALAEVPGCILAQVLAPNMQAGRIEYELAAGDVFLPTQPGEYSVVVSYGEGKQA
jgi:hypothetical protein